MSDELVLFHAPNTRSTGTAVLLEELGVPYDLHVLNMGKDEQRSAGYMAVNPMGKVPAIQHNGALVTEQVAVMLYLADAFPEAGLAPAIGDELRGPYLRWMTFYSACFEPAVVDHALKREPGEKRMMPYGDYDTVMSVLSAQVQRGTWFLGERFTAADVMWGMALSWTRQFGVIPALPEFDAYIARFVERPAYKLVRERDAALAAEQKAG
jgi:glutathione S-transferase